MRRVPQCIRFRGLRVNAQQFCRQLFGLWRRRNSTPQRSARAAIIWAKLPHSRRVRNGVPELGGGRMPFEAQGKPALPMLGKIVGDGEIAID